MSNYHYIRIFLTLVPHLVLEIIKSLYLWLKKKLDYYHHHHHVVPPARISLTLSRHFSLSFIVSGRSSGLQPISSQSCCMYIQASRPAFEQLNLGLHRSTSLMSSSLLFQQYPACLVCLTWIVFVMGGRWRIVGALWSVASRTCSRMLRVIFNKIIKKIDKSLLICMQYCMYIYIYIYIYICMCVCVWVCVCLCLPGNTQCLHAELMKFLLDY